MCKHEIAAVSYTTQLTASPKRWAEIFSQCVSPRLEGRQPYEKDECFSETYISRSVSEFGNTTGGKRPRTQPRLGARAVKRGTLWASERNFYQNFENCQGGEPSDTYELVDSMAKVSVICVYMREHEECCFSL